MRELQRMQLRMQLRVQLRQQLRVQLRMQLLQQRQHLLLIGYIPDAGDAQASLAFFT